MIWFDQLASTPVVSLKLDWHYASGAKLLEAMSPLLSKQGLGDRPTFGVDRMDAFATVFTTDEGFQYSVTSNAVMIGFAYRGRFKSQGSSVRPTFDVITEAHPYSRLLNRASTKIVEAALLLPDARARQIQQITIASNTSLEMASFPPGLSDLRDYFLRPIGGASKVFQFRFSADVRKTANTRDRCIFNISRNEDEEVLPNIILEFQREYPKTVALHEDTLADRISEVTRSASSYFEKVADGSAFAEVIGANSDYSA